MYQLKTFSLSIAILCSYLVLLLSPALSLAADKAVRVPTKKSSSKGLSKLHNVPSLFKKGINPRGSFFEVENLDEAETFRAPAPKEKTTEELLEEQVKRVVSDDPTKDPILDPSVRTSVRLDPSAPAEAKGLFGSIRMGKHKLAAKYATALVRKQKNYFFEIRQFTKIYGEALVRENALEKEDWVGAEQMLEIEMARTRNDMSALLKPDHDTAMRRIVPDPKGKAQILYFFSLSCSWCRHMAPDIERLWRVAQADENISMAALTIGKAPKTWVNEYRKFSGLNVPIYDGEKIAKQFNIRFVPTIVVIAPTTNKAYTKSGQQSFARMYQFVRTVQGIPAQLSPTIKELIHTPIGEREILQAKKAGIKVASASRGRLKSKKRVKVEVEKF